MLPSPIRALKKLEANELKPRPQLILVNCNKHPDELLKFIDVSTQIFGTHCDLCLVDSDKYVKQMKLERISDLHDKVRSTLMKHIEKLKEMDKKIDEVVKRISITNATGSVYMTKINDMERQAHKEIDFVFKRLKDRFTKYNPFKDTKYFIRDRLEEAAETVVNLDSQGYLALNTLKNFLKNEHYWKEENKNFFMDLHTRLEMHKNTETVGEKELGLIQNGFEVFIKNIKHDCEKWLKVILGSS